MDEELGNMFADRANLAPPLSSSLHPFSLSQKGNGCTDIVRTNNIASRAACITTGSDTLCRLIYLFAVVRFHHTWRQICNADATEPCGCHFDNLIIR
jgi:hypothetical protein